MSKEFKIYTAGAMEAYQGTDKAKIWRKTARIYFEKFRLNAINVRVINPTDYYNFDCKLDNNDCEIFRFDLYKVKSADVVLVNLDSIRQSIGTCIEVYEAYRSGIPVIGFLDSEISSKDELRNKIHTWVYECCTRIETGNRAFENALEHISDYYLL